MKYNTKESTIHRHFKTEILQVELAEADKFSEYRDKVYIVNSSNDIPFDKYFGVETLKEFCYLCNYKKLNPIA